MSKLQREAPGFHAKLEVLERRPAYSTRENHPLVKAVSDSYKRVIGRPAERNPFHYPMNSTTDTNHLAANGIACVSIGPVEPKKVLAEEMFVANESVSVSRIVDTTKIVALTIAKYIA
jgi:acetylornithine deacetylase/succinyl-diaminopimelate desuccinylase-like protein